MRSVILYIITFISIAASAQELIVKSFAKADGDLSAQTNARYDNNSVKCALVKIQYVGDIHDVEGNVVKPFVKRTNETWVYMTQRSRQMQVITKDYLPIKITFANYGVNALESGTTYLMVLSKPSTPDAISGGQHIRRSGAFGSVARFSRVSCRDGVPSDVSYPCLGLRLALSK